MIDSEPNDGFERASLSASLNADALRNENVDLNRSGSSLSQTWENIELSVLNPEQKSVSTDSLPVTYV